MNLTSSLYTRSPQNFQVQSLDLSQDLKVCHLSKLSHGSAKKAKYLRMCWSQGSFFFKPTCTAPAVQG